MIAELDLRQVIGREVGAEHVALVDDRPQLLVDGLIAMPLGLRRPAA